MVDVGRIYTPSLQAAGGITDIRYNAAYISKYIAKDLATAPFRKGEKRYGMSKGLRKE